MKNGSKMEELKKKYKVEYKNGIGKITKTLYPLKKLEQLLKIELEDFLKLKVISCNTERQWITLYAYLIEKGFKKEDGELISTAPWTNKWGEQFLFLDTGYWEDDSMKEEFVYFLDIIKTLKTKGAKNEEKN